MHRIRSTHVVLTLLSWEWAAAGTHPARSAWIKGTIYLPHNLLQRHPTNCHWENLAGQLIQVHIPLSINAPFMLSPLFMHPTQTPTSFPNTVSLPLASKALWECWCCSRTTHCIFQNSVFSQCGVGFWRGLYDLAVEMPLSSHLFNYLLPPHEPALLWTILPLQYLTYTNTKFYSPLLP